MKRIIMTGGGTAGHVTPNIALMPRLKEMGFRIYYIGSYNGIEKELIEERGIKYYGISSGKLRRYLDVKNLSDPFRVIKGYMQARSLIRRIHPDVVFSKGGFVSVPVVLAAKHKHIPVLIHESDMTPGLANKIAIPAADTVFCNFPETLENLPKEKAVLSGSPIRADLFEGSADRACARTGLDRSKPVILIVGGSSGSVFLNDTIRGLLPQILPHFQVLHLCGKGNLDPSIHMDGYVQQEYADEEMADYMALASLVISRAGANAICELLALHKPNILIPLALNASRGDQILNAHSFEKQGFSCVIEQEQLNDQNLLDAIHEVWTKRDTYIENMKNSSQLEAITTITDVINETAEKKKAKDKARRNR